MKNPENIQTFTSPNRIFASVVFRAEIPKFDGIIPAKFRVFFLPPKFYGIGKIPSLKIKFRGPKNIGHRRLKGSFSRYF